jgi:hypothetical protein
MVDRIVVLGKSDVATTAGSTMRLFALWMAGPVALAVYYKTPLGIHEITTTAIKYSFESLLESRGNLWHTPMTVTGIVVVAALCVLAALALRPSVFSNQQQRLSRGVSVSMYHIGVQLATVWVSTDSDNSVVQECNPRFIPRDQIIDCIVTEVILAHRIQTTVVFRLQKKQNDLMQLVNAFPGVDLNYSECAIIRSRIKTYLDHKDLIVQ